MTTSLPLARPCPHVSQGCAASPAPSATSPTTAGCLPRHGGAAVADVSSHVSPVLAVHWGLSRALNSVIHSGDTGTEQGQPRDTLQEAGVARDCTSSPQSSAREITVLRGQGLGRAAVKAAGKKASSYANPPGPRKSSCGCALQGESVFPAYLPSTSRAEGHTGRL